MVRKQKSYTGQPIYYLAFIKQTISLLLKKFSFGVILDWLVSPVSLGIESVDHLRKEILHGIYVVHEKVGGPAFLKFIETFVPKKQLTKQAKTKLKELTRR